MNDLIAFDYFYVDDTNNGTITHYKYSNKQIQQMIVQANKKFLKIKDFYDYYVENELNPVDLLDQIHKQDWLIYALLNYVPRINQSKVGVIGSSTPWVECLLLALGAQEVITIEYNKLTYGDQIQTISGEEFETFYSSSKESFDFLFSISSFDHDGLGRYGDPLNPNGDLESMKKVQTLLKPQTGLLFLTVPIGSDVIVYNLHRRYGPIRLPLLLESWEIVSRVGWKTINSLETQTGDKHMNQYLF